MKIAFTICSLDYLPQGLTTIESINIHNPDYKTIICLFGVTNEEFKDLFLTIPKYIDILLVEECFAKSSFHQNLSEMKTRYTVFELSCALKPILAKFLLENYQPKLINYFDSDILVLNKLSKIEAAIELGTLVLILTPHICLVNKDSFTYVRKQNERIFLRTGTFNGGFFAVANDAEGFEFLTWWSEVCEKNAFANFDKGLFTDQLWLNLAPALFPKLFVLRDIGYNVAYWNLDERKLRYKEKVFTINGENLVFYHFSGYIPNNLNITKFPNGTLLTNYPELDKLCNIYLNQLLKNGYKHTEPHKPKFCRQLINYIRGIISPFKPWYLD